MKYMIVTACSAKELEKKVQGLMDEKGWEPLGAHAVVGWMQFAGLSLVTRFEYSQVLINQSE